MAGAYHEFGPPRPDLSVPLPPIGKTAAAVRYGLTALREPTFDAARRRTLRFVGASVVLVVFGQFMVVDRLSEPVTICGVAFAVYAALRTASLTVLERRQYVFSVGWLAEWSATLRTARFEVVRCVVGAHTYDLTDPYAVAELVGLQNTDTTVVLDLTYRPRACERVQRRLADVEFAPALRPGVAAHGVFPRAHYELGPSGRTTYWLLDRPVRLTVARQVDPATQRAGIGNTGQPDAAPPTGERPPETT
jgi:hypothetical protein